MPIPKKNKFKSFTHKLWTSKVSKFAADEHQTSKMFSKAELSLKWSSSRKEKLLWIRFKCIICLWLNSLLSCLCCVHVSRTRHRRSCSRHEHRRAGDVVDRRHVRHHHGTLRESHKTHYIVFFKIVLVVGVWSSLLAITGQNWVWRVWSMIISSRRWMRKRLLLSGNKISIFSSSHPPLAGFIYTF